MKIAWPCLETSERTGYGSKHGWAGACGQAARARAGGAGCRLWRHRHQPALHAARMPDRGRRLPADARSHPGGAVADLLGADRHGDGEVRHLHHARRQPGRGRHPGADRAGAARHAAGAPADRGRHGDRRDGRLVVLRRQPDHPRHLGAERGGGAACRRPRPGQLRHPDHADHPGRAVRPAAIRYREGRPAVRAGDDGVVRDAGGARARADHPLSRGAGRCVARPCGGDAVQPRLARLPAAGCGGAGGDGGGGALCRHGAFRPQADPRRLVHHRAALAAAVLFRPGRPAAARAGSHREPLLPSGAGLGAGAAAAAGHRRHHHRRAGGDLRRLFGDLAGDASALSAADGADLAAAGRRHPAGADLPDLQQPGRRLRHRGDRHDGGDHAAGLQGRALARPLEAVAGGAGAGGVPDRRHGAVPRQSGEGGGGRLVPAGGGCGGLPADGDVAARPRGGAQAAGRGCAALRHAAGAAEERVGAAGAGHRGVPDRQPARPAAGAAAQHEALQGAASARRAADRRHRGRAACAGRSALRAEGAVGRILPADRPFRLQGRTGHPASAGKQAHPRFAVRADGDDLFRQPRDADPQPRQVRPAALAGTAVHLPVEAVVQRVGVFLHPAQPGGRAGHAAGNLGQGLPADYADGGGGRGQFLPPPPEGCPPHAATGLSSPDGHYQTMDTGGQVYVAQGLHHAAGAAEIAERRLGRLLFFLGDGCDRGRSLRRADDVEVEFRHGHLPF
ncbi:hypothetical protein Lal_00005155 [Lupinus albus]|nr:hypothetical protein Lal_00005155 [Lupinus albus]